MTYKAGNSTSLNISYANNGNIMSKTDVGNYTYSSVKPHAVMDIENANAYQYTSDMTTEYNDMGRIKLISQRQTYPINMEFTYGADGSLWNLDYTPSMRSTDIGGHRAWSRYYDDNYEYLYSALYRRDFYYLNDHVIAVRDYDKEFKFYVVAKDNLGSIVGIYNANGDKVFSASYDAWGKQTVTDTKDDMHLLLRGYCGHTMLNEFDLIDMKGRLYDPVVGRFLSPDNYVQLPDNSQNYNRYSYCLNNPLKYTDSSGEFFLFAAVTDFVGNLFKHGVNVSQYNWTKTKNAWDIDRGMFKGNFVQILNKWTWGLSNSVIGNVVGHALNMYGAVRKVTYLDGMAALSGVIDGNSAFTVGFYSFGPTNYTADWRDNLFVHEYGHYMQSQRLGSFYFPVVAEPSFFSAMATSRWSGMEHKERWFEVEASELGAKHFDKKYGKGAKGYQKDSPNYFNVEQFWGVSKFSYVNPRLGYVYQDKQFRHSGYKFVFWDFFSSIF